MLDETTGAATTTCSATSQGPTQIVTCAVPPRAAGAAPHSYRVVTMLDNVTDLDPGPGPFTQTTVGGTVYTTSTPTTLANCGLRTSTLKGETTYYSCDYVVYSKVLALTDAELDFGFAQVDVMTRVGADVPYQLITYVPAPIDSAPVTWNGGGVNASGPSPAGAADL